eukprot:396835-Rhodomonas_salina.3
MLLPGRITAARPLSWVQPPLSCYALAMRCPVLAQAIVLHFSHAMSGTEVGYRATLLPYAVSGTDTGDGVLRKKFGLVGESSVSVTLQLRISQNAIRRPSTVHGPADSDVLMNSPLAMHRVHQVSSYAMSGMVLALSVVVPYTVQYWHKLCGYACAMRSPVLTYASRSV